MTEESRKTRVGASSCSSGQQCILDNDVNSWCITSTPPVLKVGWEYT
jgi:hypothetical protein